MIGKIISHYKIIEKIGSGGMATVYKAEDINLKRLVALKFLPPQLIVNKDTRKRFITEAQSASALDHPNIYTIHEIDKTDDGQMFIAMGFYEGEILNQKISRGPLDIQEAINITIQTAQGLSKAHEKGIIHRDIKPANIMITTDGVVKILDFGLAKLSDHTALTRTGTMLGTLAYMSPEQACGEKVDLCTDIWSLGVLMYEMISGSLPFRGDNEQAIVYAILNKDPKPFTKIPEYIEKVIHKALVKVPEKRYQDIQELIKDLKAKSAPEIELPAMENSIVVLPFKDFSEIKENEYFSDGLTEEIITDLSKIQNLLVISRGSAMTFKDTDKKLKEIGKELNVQYALEGSIRKSGNDLRINAQLIDTKNDTHIWAEKYSGTLEDVFDIQEEVSRSIVDALQLKLSPEEEEKLAKRPIKNIQAYECYLKARQESLLWTPDALERALHYLQNGLDIIGGNAHLYAGFGYVYFQYVNMGIGDKRIIDNAGKYAQKALELDPESSDVHLVIGCLNSNVYGDQKAAIKHFKLALSINPNDDHVIGWLGLSLCHVGKIEEARSIWKNVVQLDPLSPMTWAVPGIISFYEGREESVLEGISDWFRFDPDNPSALNWYSLALVYAGRLEEALVTINQNVHEEWPDSFTKICLLIKHAIKRDTKRLMEIMSDDFTTKTKRDAQLCYILAVVFALAEKNETSLEWLEHAVNNGFINYPLISEKDKLLKNIRNEERFIKLMQRVKYEWEHFDD
jgi:serine/threonine protein kinase